MAACAGGEAEGRLDGLADEGFAREERNPRLPVDTEVFINRLDDVPDSDGDKRLRRLLQAVAYFKFTLLWSKKSKFDFFWK